MAAKGVAVGELRTPERLLWPHWAAGNRRREKMKRLFSGRIKGWKGIRGERETWWEFGSFGGKCTPMLYVKG